MKNKIGVSVLKQRPVKPILGESITRIGNLTQLQRLTESTLGYPFTNYNSVSKRRWPNFIKADQENIEGKGRSPFFPDIFSIYLGEKNIYVTTFFWHMLPKTKELRRKGEKAVAKLNENLRKCGCKAKQLGSGEHYRIRVTCPRNINARNFREALLETQKVYGELNIYI